MIPILYDKNEIAFTSNGLGRLRDCISAKVVEERNGVYELDFQYPVDGANYDLIQFGRIVGVVTDDTDDFQPFDIVSFSKPIDGVVTFHCVHISYRQSYMTVTGSNINSLADAFTMLGTAEPDNPFTYWTDKDSTGFMAAADGTPRTVRQMLGGVEGSILDAYGGEYEWDKFLVKLWSQRGQVRNFTVRYGVNMLEYNDETDSQGTYSSCVPFWKSGDVTVVGNRVDSYGATVSGRGECVPLDLTDKFETEPTTAQLESMAQSLMESKNTFLPTQNIKVSFVRLQDMGEYEMFSNLLQCGLCDTIKVIFPDYGTSGQFKIVKTVWNVLEDRYDEMELGTLSTTLSEALGISNGLNNSSGGGGGGAGGNVYKQLLWTNLNPTTGFGAQTVQLDLSGYDDVEVEWIHNTNEQSKVLYNRCKVGKSGFLFVTRVDTLLTQMRQLDANSNGIYFGACQIGSSGTIYNNHCIPYHIYGIKYLGGST